MPAPSQPSRAVTWSPDPLAGARNFLVDCVGVGTGSRVLIASEPEQLGYYAATVAPLLAAEAAALGAETTCMTVAPGAGPEDVPAALLEGIGRATHTIFVNRIGDQLRFAPLPGKGAKAITYTLDLEYLGSPFAVASYRALEELHRRIVERIAAARRYVIRCPLGTELHMDAGDSLSGLRHTGGFTVANFPVMIVPPVPASGLTGRLVLSHALTSTGIHRYDDSVVPLDSPIALELVDGRVLGIDGEPALVARVARQFDRVHSLFGGARDTVNSWHAGINPFTYFNGTALADIDRWSGVAFGSPRYAHFHMCGPIPGDICGQLFDPTITFDGHAVWDAGRLAALDEPANQDLVGAMGVPAALLGVRQPLGVPAAA